MTRPTPRRSRHQRPDLLPGTRVSIAVKLGTLLAALVALLVVVTGTMLGQLNQVARSYDDLLAHQVQQGLQARKMQVEFKKQVQEWKDILLRGSNPDDLATYTKNFHTQIAAVDNLNQQLVTSTTDPGIRDQLVAFQREHQALDAAYEAALAPFVADGGRDPSVPDRAVRGQDRPPTDRVDRIVTLVETSITDSIAQQKADLAAQQRMLLWIAGGVLLAVLVVITLVVVRIVRPVRRLTRDAYLAANESLPGAIARIREMAPDEEPPVLAPLRVDTHDELAGLGAAVSALQSRALELAVAERRAEQLSAQMLINLGRRNQNLLGRTISYITELEHAERNPDVLAKLFRLDHAATRIRRGAESMLVLAGATQTRTWSRPVPIADVARAALSEVEDYQRVDLFYVEDVHIVGTAVADLVHLVAELVENATHFSPPGTRVTMVGQHDAGSQYRLRIIDQGIGMTSRELDDANARIRSASAGPVDDQLLGLHVVGRLAGRRSIMVTLEPSAGRGITASIVLPKELLSAEDPGPNDAGQPTNADPVGVPVRRTQPGPSPDGPAAEVSALLAEPIPTPMSAPASAFSPVPALPTTAELPVVSAGASNGHAARGNGGIPRRVRGAQLPDQGHSDGPNFAPPDTAAIRNRLGALQNGRRAAQAHQPNPNPPTSRRPTEPNP